MTARSDYVPIARKLVEEGILKEDETETFGALLGERYVRERKEGERRIDRRMAMRKEPKIKEYFIKHDIPELGLKKGKVTKEEFEKAVEIVRDLIHTHNTIVGVKINQEISYEEAADHVEEVLAAYEAGELDEEGVGEAFSP
ncbi:MAG: hypothetical protein QXS74_06315 [Nitrososphaeria archaeon]